MILIIEKFFTIVFLIFMIISVISNLKQEHNEGKEKKEEKRNSEEPTWCFAVELAIVLCAILLFFGGILYLGITKIILLVSNIDASNYNNANSISITGILSVKSSLQIRQVPCFSPSVTAVGSFITTHSSALCPIASIG